MCQRYIASTAHIFDTFSSCYLLPAGLEFYIIRNIHQIVGCLKVYNSSLQWLKLGTGRYEKVDICLVFSFTDCII